MTTETNVPAQASDEPMLLVPEKVFAHAIATLDKLGYMGFTRLMKNCPLQAAQRATDIPQPDADLVKCLQGQTHTLHGMLKKAERDAERYRWLRERPYSDWKRIAFNTVDDHPCAIKCRDEEIDAAIAASKGAKP